MVLLIGNYALDQQQSMQRFGAMMLAGLTAAGVPAELLQPHARLGQFRGAGAFIAKWLAYVDKFIFFPARLRARLAQEPRISLVHICDHSNAVYAPNCRPLPVVVTCHDLLAVRGALGESTDTPATATGRILQRWIVRGIEAANAVACVSAATLRDLDRLVGNRDKQRRSVITSGLNHPYRKLPAVDARSRLESLTQLDLNRRFVLHAGSNARRKNREGVLRIFSRTAQSWDGQLIFAGERLTPELRALAGELGVSSRVVEVANPESPLLEALYSWATALIYPSRFEGFGWPIAEAQACGCPVICSDAGPMPEVAGEAGLIHPVEDEAAFAADILRLAKNEERELWSVKSLQNAERFRTDLMIANYVELYRSLAPLPA